MDRWNKINSGGDFGLLYKSTEGIELTDEELEGIWSNIFNEYIAEFGLSDEYKDHLRNLKHLNDMKCDQVIEFDSGTDALINILETEMNKKAGNNENTFGKTLAIVNKFMGYRVDPEICPVYEFLNCLELIKEQSKSA